MRTGDKIYAVIDRFTIDGMLQKYDVDGTYICDMLEKLLEKEKMNGDIYDFCVDEETFVDDVSYATGCIVVSWMDIEQLHQMIFQWEEE